MSTSATETKRQHSGESVGRLVDTGELRLAWGNPTEWKARWREESLQRHLERPLDERLRSAISLVLRRSDRERQSI